jgi:hypothetical protein
MAGAEIKDARCLGCMRVKGWLVSHVVLTLTLMQGKDGFGKADGEPVSPIRD